MKNLYVLSILFLAIAGNSQAQFSGAYQPSNWSAFSTPGTNGTTNTSGAPASIVVNGSDGGGGNANTDYTITAIASGIWSFHWEYHTNDSDPSFDYAGIMVNGSFTKLTNDIGPNDQSGNYNAGFVAAGTVIGFRVLATDNIGGNATLTISSFSPPGGILPVKLTSFIASVQNSKVQLRWKVEEEINTDHYKVQRSVDGVEFTNMATVPSQHLPQYAITDNSPNNGNSYYRLQIVDKDGSITYSSTATVKLNEYPGLSVYPNPSNGKLTIEITSQKSKKETIRIYDVNGRMVHVQERNLFEGANKIQLNLSTLRNGVYFIGFGSTGSMTTVTKQ
jgi:hypothetical protein